MPRMKEFGFLFHLLFSVYPFNFSALFLALIVSVLPKEYWNIA